MELGNLSKLEVLDLGGNRLSGEVLLSVPRFAEARGPWLTYKGYLLVDAFQRAVFPPIGVEDPRVVVFSSWRVFIWLLR